MLPGNVDPRRPEKVQRYKPATANGNGQGEDLTPDYMNILGQRTTTANAPTEPAIVDGGGGGRLNALGDNQQGEEVRAEEPAATSNATNVIPTSPQYGVAIISNADIPAETVTLSTDTVTETTAKQPPDDGKDPHSTPSRNDRFKVVKIASLEPFKRGRWKCMDYVDEAPPLTTQAQSSKVTQSTGSIPVQAGGVYLQTQSLPQQQIQQMLLQGGFTNGTQFFPQAQMMPQTQYFYPQGGNMQPQTLPQQLVNASGVPSTMPAQFINTNQPYFAAGVVPNSGGFTLTGTYPNMQYVPSNILQNQNSAFVPTSQPLQLPSNFQQSQTYAGQPNQPLVNGHAYSQQNEQQPPQQVSASLPTQPAKNVILNTNVQQPVVSQPQLSQPNIQNQIPVGQNSTQSQSVPVIQNQQYQQNFQQPPTQQQQQPQIQQNFDQNPTNNVYTNPQFDVNVNSLTVLENPDISNETVNETNSAEATAENADDPSKTNPVVNAIDNKIEQAMDLVKSHLMYTVREEVEVLKEKIAELMEKIQQLESENNFLRSQLPKSGAAVVAPPPTSTASTTTTATSSNSNETGGQQQ